MILPLAQSDRAAVMTKVSLLYCISQDLIGNFGINLYLREFLCYSFASNLASENIEIF